MHLPVVVYNVQGGSCNPNESYLSEHLFTTLLLSFFVNLNNFYFLQIFMVYVLKGLTSAACFSRTIRECFAIRTAAVFGVPAVLLYVKEKENEI